MATQWKGKGRSLTRVAGIGAALALVATGVVAAPAFATKNPATVTLSSSVPSGLVTGQAVAFTATVTTGGAPATGNIIFTVTGSEGTTATCDGGNTQPLTTSGGVTTATCSFAKGLLGKPLFYTVNAHLVDPNYKATDATLTQQIGKSLTNTTISGLPGQVLAGQAFSFTATVEDESPGTGSPTGSMEFAVCKYNVNPCSGAPGGTFAMPNPTPAEQALNENKITFSLPAGVLQPGFYDVSADYVGDSNYWSSESSFSFILVDKVDTTLSLVASNNPTYDGGREVLRAVVHADNKATASLPGPGGNVTYTITGASGDTLVCQETGTGVIQVGTKSANQGVARCTISGAIHTIDSPYTITAVYSGNSDYDGSSGSGSLSVINPPA
jgi:Bacterial Ig-like domain (group 3)